jgi:hypothetical protein
MVATRPTSYPPLKGRQVQAAHKKSGGQYRLSAIELRELERAAELERRAKHIRDKEQRKRLNQQKRAEKERQKREAHRQKLVEDGKNGKMFLGPTQHPRSQFRMERFVQRHGAMQQTTKLDQNSKLGDRYIEPWEDDDMNDDSLLDFIDHCEIANNISAPPGEDSFTEDITLVKTQIQSPSSRESDEFDFGLCTQDFRDVTLDLPERIEDSSCKSNIMPPNIPSALMPPPSMLWRPAPSDVSRPALLSLPHFDFSSSDLDQLALADYEPSQVPR